jgi:hypothetical protein
MRENISRFMVCLVAAIFFIIPSVLFANTVTVTAVGEYIMGDNDTYTEAKRLALEDAKRIALEKVGTYIESKTEVKEGAVTSDEIRQYTAGIVKYWGIKQRLLK